MFESESGVMGQSHVGLEGIEAGNEAATSPPSWQEIDRQLRRVARRRTSLDAEELRWLAMAERAELHRHLGFASMLEYAERVLGHAPKTGKERLRVARALTALPVMAAALESGALCYSAVRELSRVAKPQTEAEWVEAVRGKVLREIEELVAEHKPGDRPSDPGDPSMALRPITLELTPATLALFRDARRFLEDEMGHALTDDELIAAMCSTVVGGAAAAAAVTAAAAATAAATAVATESECESDVTRLRAPYQVCLTICPSCDRGWHDAGGRSIAVPASTIEQALCDAEYLGRSDAAVPARATQEVPPAIARLVLRRDRARCQVPGCRASRWLQVHHIVHRGDGGTNDPCNLLSLCFAHHQAHHQGKLGISGSAPDALVFDLDRWNEPPAPRGAETGSPR